jgi:hypothetical protein
MKDGFNSRASLGEEEKRESFLKLVVEERVQAFLCRLADQGRPLEMIDTV